MKTGKSPAVVRFVTVNSIDPETSVGIEYQSRSVRLVTVQPLAPIDPPTGCPTVEPFSESSSWNAAAGGLASTAARARTAPHRILRWYPNPPAPDAGFPGALAAGLFRCCRGTAGGAELGQDGVDVLLRVAE